MRNAPIRSVLVETRTYWDSNGNPMTSALVFINGATVGQFPPSYGAAPVMEQYTVKPYLERLGVLSESRRELRPDLAVLVRDIGADYYLVNTRVQKKNSYHHAHEMTAEDFWQELSYRETRRPHRFNTGEEIAQGKKDPKNPDFQIGYECEQCGGEPPEVSTYEMKDGRVFCGWCRDEVNP
jgi:hypothetical protein